MWRQRGCVLLAVMLPVSNLLPSALECCELPTFPADMDLPESFEFRVGRLAQLTRREAEVLLWTAEGKTAWEVGKILGTTEGTARAHLAHILGKLDASNKPHAVARAFALGILARKLLAGMLIACGALASTPDAEAARIPRRPVTRAVHLLPSLAGTHGRF